ncbi:ASCH domain-containing protein [Saccharospirillum alexandrii]|uniref:ASCH domain-containing protein n=1 Tax=Saccharospirillum alexandrii TaxID=2448477 RepID=UPI000FDA01F3|nr:ASCH domain-containing protein [Saccharospirillum alexandrii]
MMFSRKLKSQILSGKKTGTVRNKADSDYHSGQELDALLDEDGSKICRIRIISIEPVQYSELKRQHAKAEYLPFVFMLKWIVRRIYPGENELFFIRFKVLAD